MIEWLLVDRMSKLVDKTQNVTDRKGILADSLPFLRDSHAQHNPNVHMNCLN
ncbi:hypothetical protein [Lysinibacillus boronitolerans]|uniref:hypothetical protein n=1 Tax=Lysinibacillus boronitolerans TaxID=309788 RepID=UPI0038621CE1